MTWWSEDQLEQLRKTWPRPHVPGRTRKACLIKANKLGYRSPPQKRNPWTPEQDRVMTELYLSGMQNKHIARKLGRKPWEIDVRRAQLGLQRLRSIPSENVSIKLPVHICETIDEWCLQEGVSRSRLLRVLIEEGIHGRRTRNPEESNAALRASASPTVER